jgi:F0F1-type ATP synthase membrane subunit b/b'
MAIVILLAETSIQLVPDGTILFHIVLILVMIAVLNRTLFQPINRILAEREKKGGGALAEAAEMESRVSLSNKQYSDALRTARASGYKLMEERRAEDLRDREVRVASLKGEIEARLSQERSLIETQATEAREGLDPLSLAKKIRDQILKPLEDSGRVD